MDDFDEARKMLEEHGLKSYTGQTVEDSSSKSIGMYAPSGFSNSIKKMCEEIGIDADSFYESLALNNLLYVCNLHDFMEAHPEYDHIEYIGEMKTLDDIHEIIKEEFSSYLTLYAIEEGQSGES